MADADSRAPGTPQYEASTSLPKQPVWRPESTPTLARFLLDQLREAGVRNAFGIPGNFIICLCRVIEEVQGIDLLTLSHEPGVGFAARGAARGCGQGVACATYGAGALNRVKSITTAWVAPAPEAI